MADTEVQIEYRVPCGLLPAAEMTAHALLSTYGRRLAGLRLIPGHGGVFRVDVGATTVFDKASGDGFDLDTIVERAGARLPASSMLEL
ncbi:MAG TPA: Rdx family protein [Pseudonocardiaceae bacterium]|nr:Rdx family protein [Pseudonocardiaceae bacterium]